MGAPRSDKRLEVKVTPEELDRALGKFPPSLLSKAAVMRLALRVLAQQIDAVGLEAVMRTR